MQRIRPTTRDQTISWTPHGLDGGGAPVMRIRGLMDVTVSFIGTNRY